MGKSGFFIVELLVAIAMLSGVGLLFCRFQWAILQVQGDALLLMAAIDSAIEHLDVTRKGKKDGLEAEKYNISQKTAKIGVLRHNVPQKMVRQLDAACITVGWTSLAVAERSVEFFSMIGEKKWIYHY